MSTVTGSLSAQAAIQWQLSKDITGFEPVKQGVDKVSFVESLLATTYTQVQFTQYTLTAGSAQSVDLRTFTAATCESVTASGIIALIIDAQAGTTGGILKLEPDSSSNPLVWPFNADSYSLSLPVGTAGACMFFCAGVVQALTSTAKSLKITNTGSQTITVKLAAVVAA